MNKINYIIAFLITTVLLTSCNNSVGLNNGEKEDKQVITEIDSIKLTTLVRNIYQWHMSNYSIDFPYKFNNSTDSIFTGIDWDSYTRNIDVLKKTNFFNHSFFTNHRITALRIDSSIRQANVEWRNIKDGISLWETNADDWCGCQDYPDNYWKTITLHEFVFRQDTVSFNWTWGNANGFQANKYELKAAKEDGTWKISYMEGFHYYGTVADYNKIMNK